MPQVQTARGPVEADALGQVLMHAPGQPAGLAVQRGLVEQEGVDPTRVVLAHSGDTSDADHLAALAEAGFVLGMDRFGINLETTFQARADIVVEMCPRGFAHQMVLSQDASCYLDWIKPSILAFLPQWHYEHLRRGCCPTCWSTA